jgi:hypothetical protein
VVHCQTRILAEDTAKDPRIAVEDAAKDPRIAAAAGIAKVLQPVI